jgi:hypothetical protein
MKQQSPILRTILLSTFLTLSYGLSYAQSFNEDKVAFGNFLKRMYMSAPFDGVKVVDDYNREYIVSVISFEKAKYSNPSTMNRVAQVKAQSQANTFINGASINSDLIIKTSERKSKNTVESTIETIETIKENAYGFTQGLELLTNFENTDGDRMVFIYIREIKTEKKKK